MKRGYYEDGCLPHNSKRGVKDEDVQDYRARACRERSVDVRSSRRLWAFRWQCCNGRLFLADGEMQNMVSRRQSQGMVEICGVWLPTAVGSGVGAVNRVADWGMSFSWICEVRVDTQTSCAGTETAGDAMEWETRRFCFSRIYKGFNVRRTMFWICLIFLKKYFRFSFRV